MVSRTARLEPIARPERARPEPAEREDEQLRPPPAPDVLVAGNQAVARMLARYAIADAVGDLTSGIQGGVESLTRLATQEIGGSVGRRGKNDAVDVAVVRGLLQAAGFGDPDLGAAIERYQREVLGWSVADGRVDPGRKTLRALRSGQAAARQEVGAPDVHAGESGAAEAASDGGTAAAPAPRPAASTAAPASGAATHGPTGDGARPAAPVPAPAAAHEPEPPPGPEPAPDDPARAESERVFREFAAAREPLYAAMRAATDDEARRGAIQALSAFDAGRLPQLRAQKAALGGRWDIKDTAARDAVLAAIQLEAATDAMGDLMANSEVVHKRVADASGMPLSSAWCGMFTVDHYRHSGMDKDLAAGFLHVDNVHDYFTYRHSRNPKRIPKWIWADRQWHDLRSYHEERSAPREWLTGEEVWKGGNLDIRPGDTALIDHQGDGKADHIVKVQSYDPATSTMLTIGGNDAGFVIDRKPKAGRKVSANQERAEAAVGGEALGKEAWHGGAGGGHVGLSVHKVTADGKKLGTIFGIGRPSLVDFEEHPYDHGNNLRKPPPPLKE